jgi:hypothetical protein
MSPLLFVALLLAGQQSTPPSGTPVPGVQEHVTVERVVISGRVIDRFGNPIRGLTPGDLRLRVDGVEAPIEVLDPLESEQPAAEPAGVEAAVRARRAEAPGPMTRLSATRNILMLFQWEISGQKDRGFLRMMRQARIMVEASEPSDRIAVLGYGSSLRLLQDFTNDRAALDKAIRSIRSTSYRGQPSDGAPSIADSVAACPPTGSIEKAIRCVALSLQPIAGTKSLVFFGWTIGRPRRGVGLVEYPAMVEGLGRSRTSVFVLDVSDGYHWLPSGLKQIAIDTGGLYNGGCLYEMAACADLARVKTQRTLSGGGYDLVFRDPTGRPGWHEVEIECRDGKRIAIFQRWYRI